MRVMPGAFAFDFAFGFGFAFAFGFAFVFDSDALRALTSLALTGELS